MRFIPNWKKKSDLKNRWYNLAEWDCLYARAKNKVDFSFLKIADWLYIRRRHLNQWFETFLFPPTLCLGLPSKAMYGCNALRGTIFTLFISVQRNEISNLSFHFPMDQSNRCQRTKYTPSIGVLFSFFH